MMEEISIERKTDLLDGWEFEVVVGEDSDTTTHLVILDQAAWEPFADLYDTPDELIQSSFEFLLQREPKESIQEEFELPEIARHFPEFQEEMLV